MIFSTLSSLSTIATTSPSRLRNTLSELSEEPSTAAKQLWSGCTTFARRATPQVLHPTFDLALPLLDAVVDRAITVTLASPTPTPSHRSNSPFFAISSGACSASPVSHPAGVAKTVPTAKATTPTRSTTFKRKVALLVRYCDLSRSFQALSPNAQRTAYQHGRALIESEDGHELRLEQARGGKSVSDKEDRARVRRWEERIKARMDDHLASLVPARVRVPASSPLKPKMQATHVKTVERRSFHATSTVCTGPLSSDTAQIVDLRVIRRIVHPFGPSFVRRASHSTTLKRRSSPGRQPKRAPSLRQVLLEQLSMDASAARRKANQSTRRSSPSSSRRPSSSSSSPSLRLRA
ncbi:hypothetical protein JCM6882_003077 [Rhodosporidiobolus microsporus]